MKFKNYNNEKSLGYFISITIIFLISYFYFKNDELNHILNLTLLLNLSITFFFPIVFRPLSITLILLGEFIGKIVSPIVFFIIFMALITPIGFFYRMFIYKIYNDWLSASEGNDDDFKHEF